MPMSESLTLTVTLTVEVDGHRLTFQERTGSGTRAVGARYDGADPSYTIETLEGAIRRVAAEFTAEVDAQARASLGRLYPVAGDPSPAKKGR